MPASLARQLERESQRAIALLRCWVAGCGDEHFSTKEQCCKLLETSGRFLASLPALDGTGSPEALEAAADLRATNFKTILSGMASQRDK